MPTLPHYTLIILAGGRGQRMGGVDKGLVEIDGEPLCARLLRQLSPAPTRVVISANRNQQRYQHWADQVVSDQRSGFQGPLAGLEAALLACEGLCLCLPCDLLDPPAALIPQLLATASAAAVTVLHDGQRRQPLCLALDAGRWRQSLADYLQQGQRSAHGWLDRVALREARIDSPLTNLNQLPE